MKSGRARPVDRRSGGRAFTVLLVVTVLAVAGAILAVRMREAAGAGPEVGGPHAPYYQSERADIHKAAAEKLLAEGRGAL